MDGYELMMALVDAEAPHAPRLVALPDLLGMLPDIHPAQLNGTAVRVEYEDAKGNSSIRWVTIRSIDRGPPAKLNGHCWAKNRYRAFRADRILSVSDEFGESCSGEEFFLGLDIDVRAETDGAPPRRSRKNGVAVEPEDENAEGEKAPQVRGQKKPLATGQGYTPSTNLKPSRKSAKAPRPQPVEPQTEVRAPAPARTRKKYPAWMWVAVALLWGMLCVLVGAALVSG